MRIHEEHICIYINIYNITSVYFITWNDSKRFTPEKKKKILLDVPRLTNSKVCMDSIYFKIYVNIYNVGIRVLAFRFPWKIKLGENYCSPRRTYTVFDALALYLLRRYFDSFKQFVRRSPYVCCTFISPADRFAYEINIFWF